MKTVFMIGGTGFVGSWMHKHNNSHQSNSILTDNIYYVCAFGRKMYEETDIENYPMSINYVVHSAAIDPSRSIECARNHNARLLYISSGAVYHPENPNEYYHNVTRWEAQCLNSGVDVVVARLFAVRGQYKNDAFAETAFTKAAQSGEPLRIWGDGTAVRSYMDGAEMARWLWSILLRGESGECYDVGSDEPITLLQLARDIRDGCNSKSEIIVENRVPDPMPVYLPMDTAKTKRLLV